MTSTDKAAIGWTIGIVFVFVGIVAAISSIDSGAPAPSAPSMDEPDEATMVPESAPEKTQKTGWERLASSLDPGIGHETHQLAIILPPSDKVYSGTLKYDASELIQLVTLHGPLAAGEDNGQATWTPDGETIFGLTFIDPGNSKGSWEFSGNALAVHTMNPTPFIVDFKVDYEETMMEETMMEEPMIGEPQTVTVILPAGTSVPGCEETNECFVPELITINAGDTVSWDNIDTAAHTVTSGSPADGPDGTFDSSLLMGGATFEVTFDKSGSYDYFCMVHPWMVGDVQVN